MDGDRLEILWGAEAIAVELGVSRRQAFYMLESGALPPAKKIGAKWCVDRRALLEFFRGEASVGAT